MILHSFKGLLRVFQRLKIYHIMIHRNMCTQLSENVYKDDASKIQTSLYV